ncbi:MAG: hypothetical protein HC925_00180 [Coleofasciculaceae cyanobacterium SM2_3_26]|nr:hypothetical protein [Coleofasciculaceae cyanobacterium SM2_3_26]
MQPPPKKLRDRLHKAIRVKHCAYRTEQTIQKAGSPRLGFKICSAVNGSSGNLGDAMRSPSWNWRTSIDPALLVYCLVYCC